MARRRMVGALCGALGLADLALLNLVLVPRAWPPPAVVDPPARQPASRRGASPDAGTRAPSPGTSGTTGPGPAAIARRPPGGEPAPATAEPAARPESSGVRLVVHFASSSSAVGESDEAALRALARALRRQRRVWIRVEGHTDRRGESDLNQRLSWLRAQAVAAILIDERIPAGWIDARGLGASRPLGAEEARNRRAEIRATTRREER